MTRKAAGTRLSDALPKSDLLDVREWARDFLQAKGLPAAQDRARVAGPIVAIRGRNVQTWYDDTPENWLLRVTERFEKDSAEAWAARIELARMAGRIQGETEDLFLSAVSIQSMLPDAVAGRKSREGGSKGGRTTKDKRTRTGDRVAEWRKALATRQNGKRGPVADAAWVRRNCDSASALKPATIRRYLQKKD